MSTTAQVADAIRHIVTSVADKAARHSSSHQRRPKLIGAFVQALVFGCLANPQATAEERAQAAAMYGVAISAYSLDKRCTERAAGCLRRGLAALHQAVVVATPVVVPTLRRFTGVYLYDG